MKPVLRIFVAEHCPGCAEARGLAARLQQAGAGCAVEIIDIDQSREAVPEAVFATPTYMLGERIIALGNPSLAELLGWLEEAGRSLL